MMNVSAIVKAWEPELYRSEINGNKNMLRSPIWERKTYKQKI